MSSDSTQLAILTPPGRGAVATIGVRGPQAIELVGRRFEPATGVSLASFPTGRVVFGKFRTQAAAEELVVGLIGPHEVEVHCHGGLAAVGAVAAALVAEGCEQMDWQTWTRESCILPLPLGEGTVRCESIRAEALIALASARTERTAAILLDQWRGALSLAVADIVALIRRQDWTAADLKLTELLARSELGRHLTQPWKVVLAGRPNVGKSSLINALVGFRRSIVWSEPGTTRDVVTAATALDGWPIELADTAGLRTAEGEIEAEGIARARRQIAEADLVLLVSDLASEWTAEDAALLAEVQSQAPRVLLVHNKLDVLAAGKQNSARPAGIALSALTGLGLADLASEIARQLVPQPPARGTPVPFTDEQRTCFQAATLALRQQDLTAAECLAPLCE